MKEALNWWHTLKYPTEMQNVCDKEFPKKHYVQLSDEEKKTIYEKHYKNNGIR